MHLTDLEIDIATFAQTTIKEIKQAYRSAHARLVRAQAPELHLMRITSSFHEVMKAKASPEITPATVPDEGHD